MDLGRLIAPTGIAAGALFLISIVSGFFYRRMRRVHAVTGYLCLAVVLFHSAAAVICNIIEPLGVLSSLGMIATILSGAFRRKRAHIALGIVTLMLTIAHVVIVAANN